MQQQNQGRGKQGTGHGVKALEKVDVYGLVNSRIIERLEAGVAPWNSPSIARVGFPRNFSTGSFYRGINVFLLASAEFQSPYFLTYNQARELGGQVRKGEKGLPIVKLGQWVRKLEGEPVSRDEGDEEGRAAKYYLRHYTVFNSCQIEGIEFPEPPKCDTFTESQQAEAARQVIEGMPNKPQIIEGRRATPCYIRADDEVHMPSRETFRAEWRFYKTMFHELGHATGHESRLARKSLLENRGYNGRAEDNQTYCLEELVAEMTAAYVGAAAGIVEDDFQNSAAYLQSWIKRLSETDNKKWLVPAAAEAQKAADYILGTPTMPRE